MAEDRVEWTPTAPEIDALVQAGTRSSWRIVGLPVLGMTVVLGGVFGVLRDWPPSGFLLILAVGCLAAGWSWWRGRRAVVREFASSYPVGETVGAEAGDVALVLHTADGRVELPWGRLGRPRPGDHLLVVRDLVAGRWLMVPRPLFPDPWLDRLGRPRDQA